MLIHLPLNFILYLVILLNCLLSLTTFTDSWKRAIVVPLPKGGEDVHAPDSYCLISLLSWLSKIYEHVLFNRLKAFYNSHDLFIPEQFGFRADYSTQHEFLRDTEFINAVLGKGSVREIVFLDVQKASDEIWHVAFIYKLIALINLLKFIPTI